MDAIARHAADQDEGGDRAGRVAESIGSRWSGLMLAGGSLAVLVVAAGLTPREAGHGTHEQLGLPACGSVQMFGVPCPTCGMTTAFTHAADADLLSSFLTQPMGAVLAVGTACLFWLALFSLWTGVDLSRAASALGVWRWLARRGLAFGIAAFGGAWLYKMITW